VRTTGGRRLRDTVGVSKLEEKMRISKMVPQWAVRVIGTLSLLCAPTVALAGGWTPWVTDGALTCGVNQLVRGFGCAGPYCDSARLLCSGTDPFSIGVWNYYWSPPISEETDGDNKNQHICLGPNESQGAVTGIACHGPHCDSIELLCAAVTRPFTYCTWSDWQSEEQGSVLFPSNPFTGIAFVAAGVECRGPYCDDKRFYLCTW
jgi:hypothetical protein